jgi:hypothetical protein
MIGMYCIVEDNSQQQVVCKHYNAILQFDTNVFCSRVVGMKICRV